jgi:hypothetical protein
MKIVNEFPPIISRILEVFPTASQPGVVFAWGDTIYNPCGVSLPRAIVAHEEVHGERQMNLVRDIPPPDAAREWWEQYLKDQDFRYREEVHAHAAEFTSQTKRSLIHGDRNYRAQLLQSTAQRLIAELYNYQPRRALSKAMSDIEAAVRGQYA